MIKGRITSTFAANAISIRRCALLLAFVGAIGNPLAAQAPTLPSSPVQRYLDAAIDSMARLSVHRDSVDWPALRDSVQRRAAGARRTDDAWRALEWALRRVDPHSFLQTPRPFPPLPSTATTTMSPAGAAPSGPPPGPVPIDARLVQGRFGYLLVPMVVGLNRPSFVDSLQTYIRTFDAQGACGWIVDLRRDHGGNMWPMLAGLGPLLADSIVGGFGSGPDVIPWRYRNGHAWSGSADEPAWGGIGTGPPHTLRDPTAPVALLVGRGTASSGEATLLAFLGRPNTRSFGEGTAGFNSVNQGVQLPDSATMLITVGYSVDRLRRSYPLKVQPDELIATPASSPLIPLGGDENDLALARARDWLNAHDACRR